MPPISEKKSQLHFAENSKEIVSNDSSQRRPLEILDFRVTWLDQLRRQTYKKGQVPLLDAYNTSIADAYRNNVNCNNDANESRKIVTKRTSQLAENNNTTAFKTQKTADLDVSTFNVLFTFGKSVFGKTVCC